MILKPFCCAILLFILFFPSLFSQELVYAEMEFPLSFISHLRDYRLDPLARFQTEVEGRIIKLSCDSLLDIYEIRPGQLAYRSCLGSWQTIDLGNKQVLNFNMVDAFLKDGRPLSYGDVLFALDYKKFNKNSWIGNVNISITKKGNQSFDAFFADSAMPPKPGEFYFPLVNKAAYEKSDRPSEAFVSKTRQTDIGYGRYRIEKVEDNSYILFKRNPQHPYYKNLALPKNLNHIESLKMQAFPKAVINRNEQFISGRVHLLTSVTQADRSYILNSYPKAVTSVYSDDSYSAFVFNCYQPYLKLPVVRKALNYASRKKLILQKTLGGEGEIISGPLPRRNFFYNLTVAPYSDSAEKAYSLLYLYCKWGLDLYETSDKVYVSSSLISKEGEELERGDQILSVERKDVRGIEDVLAGLSDEQQNVFRLRIVRGQRIFVKRLERVSSIPVGILNTLVFRNNKIEGFPELTLIANNPEGKNPLVKEICGALKEDFARIGIKVKLDYLDGQTYYPRLRQGKFDLAYRNIKITGTPSLYRMFYKGSSEDIENTNYGAYSNTSINELAIAAKSVTDIQLLKNAWKKAHEILHHDPPYIYLWSRRHIIMYNPSLRIAPTGPKYTVPYGNTKINGLINLFNEVHLWAWQEEK